LQYAPLVSNSQRIYQAYYTTIKVDFGETAKNMVIKVKRNGVIKEIALEKTTMLSVGE